MEIVIFSQIERAITECFHHSVEENGACRETQKSRISNITTRLDVEDLPAHTIPQAIMVWHDADATPWRVPWRVFCNVPLNDWPRSQRSILHLHYNEFVSYQARRYDATPILTFDQPLFWKALTIIQSRPDGSDLKGMALRLGRFHMQMSFLGSIGHLMAGSGLQALLEASDRWQCCPAYVDWQGYLQSRS